MLCSKAQVPLADGDEGRAPRIPGTRRFTCAQYTKLFLLADLHAEIGVEIGVRVQLQKKSNLTTVLILDFVARMQRSEIGECNWRN